MVTVQFLGTSGSVPTEKRAMPAVYVEYNGNRLLFDCGEGTQRQMRIAKIPFMRLDKIFISHFHADHCLGLGGLIQTMDLFKRTKKLEIYGPEGIHDVIQKVISTGHFILEGFDLEINEISAKRCKQIYADEFFRISCAPIDHSVPCLAYCFEEKEKRRFLRKRALSLGVPEGPMFRSLKKGESVEVDGRIISPDEVLGPAKKGKKITYVSDSRPSKNAITLAKESDLLIHEATFSDDLKESAIQGGHSTSKEAAEIAKSSGSKMLYMTHISQRYSDASTLEKEACEIFKKSYLASDFDKIEI